MRTNIKAFPTLILACFLSLNLCFPISAQAKKKPKLPPTQVSVSPTTILEGESTTLVFSKAVNPSQPVTVNYALSGTAVWGTDYVVSGIPGQVTIPAGAPSASVTLTALTDNVFPEPNETVVITLRGGAGYSLPKAKKKARKPTVTIVDVVPSGPIEITSVSNSNPLPLAPLTLTTTGIAQAGVVSVRFFNDAGFLVTVPAARVNSEDGKIVIGAPLYIDPASKNITAGAVSMILIQGNSFSAPVSLNIQDLPPLSAYGLQSGAVSSAIFTLDTSLLGGRLNVLQAATVIQNVNTTSAQANTKALLASAIKAKHEVEGIAAQNSISSWGQLPDGTPIQFDRGQLDMVDRVIALYLYHQFHDAIVPPVGGQLRSLVVSSGPPDASLVVQEVVTRMTDGTFPTLISYGRGSEDHMNAGLAAISALGTSALTAAHRTIGEGPGNIAGLVTGTVTVANTFNTFLGHVQEVAVFNAYGDPTSGTAESLDIQNTADTRQLAVDLLEYYSGAAKALSLGNGVSEGASAVLSGIVRTISTGNSGAAKSDEATVDASTQPSVLSELRPVSGTFNPPLPAEAGPSSMGLCCFGTKSLGITGVSDYSGKYTALTPVNVGGTSYDNIKVTASDPVSGAELGSTTVDLTGLADHPVTVPPFTGGIITKIYDGTYSGHFSGTQSCTVPGVGTIVGPPVNNATLGPFTIFNASVIGGSGFSGSVDFTGHLNMTIPTSVGAITFTGTISILGTASGTWFFGGMPPGCRMDGTWDAHRL